MPLANTEASTAARSITAPASERRTLAFIVFVAFVLRVSAMLIIRTYRFPALPDHFSFGWETGRLARSIALGHGFTSPFHSETGPSAWIAPLYPYFLAGVFKFFGVYSAASAKVVLTVNSLCSALTCVPLYRIAACLLSRRAALVTAWIWALMPYAMYWAIRFAWETSFATLMLALAFWLALRLERENRLAAWLEFALVWALIALSNPSLLAFLPFCGFWILHRQRQSGSMRFRFAVCSGALFCALLAPWMVRNYLVFHKLIPIRGNFGVELRLGNGPGADGQWMYYLHPTQDPFEFERYRLMGEAAYVDLRKQEALAWVQANPATFAAITLKRVFFFWCGTPRSASTAEFTVRNLIFTLSSALTFLGLLIAFRRRELWAWLFLWLLVSVPMVYYFTFTHPRYRHPIEPEMLLLMVYLFTQVRVRRSPAQPQREA